MGGFQGEVDQGLHAFELAELLLHPVDAGGARHALDVEFHHPGSWLVE
jgi:hypothetical protein